MPAYTIQQDLPWMVSGSAAGGSSTSLASDISDVPPLRIVSRRTEPYHAQARREVYESGRQLPQQSRLPVFQQVRSILQPRRSPAPSAGDVRWDPYSGEPSLEGKAGQVQPSNYQPPYQSNTRRRSLERRRLTTRTKSVRYSRSVSPVSMLHPEEYDYEYRPSLDMPYHNDFRSTSPVSSVSTIATRHSRGRSDTTVDMATMTAITPQPVMPITPVSLAKVPKRKPITRATPSPAPSDPRTSVSSIPIISSTFIPGGDAELDAYMVQSRPSFESSVSSHARNRSQSHFSWTTYAASIAQSSQPADPPTPISKAIPRVDSTEPESRFSWSTVATAPSNHPSRLDSPPPSPPPPVPDKYRAPPIQSILSRQRAIPRAQAPERAPERAPLKVSPIRVIPDDPPASLRPVDTATTLKLSAPISPRFVSDPRPRTADVRSPPSELIVLTGTRQRGASHGQSSALSNGGVTNGINPNTPSTTGAKQLPAPPPEANESDSPLTHLENLLRTQQDKVHQRTNIERLVASFSAMETASPLDVSFGQLRDAKRKLEELRITLDEVKLEERDIGIAISRARRKEGEEEGLWVRRVLA